MPRSLPHRPPAPGPVPTAPLTQQQQLDLPRRFLAVLPEVAVDHLAALHGRLVLGAQCAAHGGRASPRPRRRGRLAARGEAGPEAAPLRPQLRQAGGKVCELARRRPGRPSPPAGDTPRSAPLAAAAAASAAAAAAAAGGRAAAAPGPREPGVRAPPRPRPCPPRDHSQSALPPARPPSRARALGQRPLRRPRARVVAAPGASRVCPRGAQRWQPSPATAGCPQLPLPTSWGSVRTCPLWVRMGRLPKLPARKERQAWAFEHAWRLQPSTGLQNVSACVKHRGKGSEMSSGRWETRGGDHKQPRGNCGGSLGATNVHILPATFFLPDLPVIYCSPSFSKGNAF